MPLIIEHVETGEQFDAPDAEAIDHNKRVTRRVFCTGCGTGAAYSPSQWVHGPDQVKSWFTEHEDHDAVKAKKK